MVGLPFVPYGWSRSQVLGHFCKVHSQVIFPEIKATWLVPARVTAAAHNSQLRSLNSLTPLATHLPITAAFIKLDAECSVLGSVPLARSAIPKQQLWE